MYVHAQSILNPKHDVARPPGEVENGAVIPVLRSPAAARRDPRRARSGRRVHLRGAARRDRGVARGGPRPGVRRVPARSRGRTAPRARQPAARAAGPPCSRSARTRAPPATAHSAGSICFDTYTPILGGTFAAALGGASAALTPPNSSRRAPNRQVYVLTRPPGHHAERDRCGGYCYFNNAALAAERLVEARQGRDARSRRSPRQRHAAHLLRARRRAHGVDPRRPGDALPVLLGLRGRDRHGRGTRAST